MSRSLALLGGCVAGHALLVLWAGPWWAPNLTLIGLILAVARSPRWWWLLAGLAGCFSVSWSIRFPRTILLACLALGWLIRWMAARWDVLNPRVQEALAVLACGVLASSALWMDDLWSWRLAGAAAVHVALTGAALRLLQQAG